jgi:phosphoribosyl-AMP cyclohydrolase / phosphoribosyl-ATP pyrophosphohydrolase
MTDRRLTGAPALEALRFDARGLVPVVAQDARTGEVLMVAWATREALQMSLESGFMHYWSRSRKSLWKKGETSGNVQALESLHADCDGDTVLARVTMEGPACHTGEATCFGELAPGPDAPRAPSAPGSVIDELWAVLEERDRDRPDGSWTTRLLSDENLRLKKLGEETVELVSALVRGDERASEEAADLLYHVLVALKGAGRSWAEVEAELVRRRS